MNNFDEEKIHLLVFSLGRSRGAVLSSVIEDLISTNSFRDLEELVEKGKQEVQYRDMTLQVTALYRDLHCHNAQLFDKSKIIIPKLYSENVSDGHRRGYIVQDPENICEIPLSKIHPLPDLIMATLKVQMIWGVAEIGDQLVLIMDLPPLEEQ